MKLAITTGGVSFRNPILTASGTFGYGKEFENLTDLGAIGGLVTKGISPAPRFGNATPRICETASGMLNSIGLENVGVEGFASDKLPYLRACGTRVLVNFFGVTFDEYVDCGERLARLDGVDALEMNVSCPNIKAGGIEFGTDPRVLGDLVRQCRAAIKKPLWIKLTPNTVGHRRAREGVRRQRRRRPVDHQHHHRNGDRRADAAAQDRDRLRRPVRARPSSRSRCAWSTRCGAPACRCRSPGIGGIQDATDAIEFFLAGASTVQVGTQSFVDPDASGRIVRDLESRLRADGISDVQELVGALRTDPK